MCPLGLSLHEDEVAKVTSQPGESLLQQHSSAGNPSSGQQEVKVKRLLSIQVLGFLHGHTRMVPA